MLPFIIIIIMMHHFNLIFFSAFTRKPCYFRTPILAS